MSTSCIHSKVEEIGDLFVYEVQRHKLDYFWHKVRFNSGTLEISCTCHMVLSSGFLCAHCLRIYTIHNVQVIPEHYFLHRWRRDANVNCVAGRVGSSESDFSGYSVWRMSMVSQFINLVSAARGNGKVKEMLELSLKNTRELYEFEISTRDADGGGMETRDPVKRDLGERNVRWKSDTEKIYKGFSASKGIKKRSATKATRERMYDHLVVEYPSHVGKYVHPDL